MEIILIILTSVFMSAFLFGAYYLGTLHKEKTEGITVTEDNKDFIEEMQKWRNFSGR